jgi:hypothetical protein
MPILLSLDPKEANMREGGKTTLKRALRLGLSIQMLFFCILLPGPFRKSGRVAAEKLPNEKTALYLVISGEPDRDVFQIDRSTLLIAGQTGTGIKPSSSGFEYKDVNGDGLLDLLLLLNDDSAVRQAKGSRLTGATYNGVAIDGSWYVAERDSSRGTISRLFAGSIQTAVPSCTLGPFRRTIGEELFAGRLIPNGVASTCGVTKPCPGTDVTFDTGEDFNGFLDPFRVNMSTRPVCVTVTTTAFSCASGVHTTAILGDLVSFTDLCHGYAGDSGGGTGTGGTTTFSFTVPPGELYSLVFMGETPLAQCDDFGYTISISPCTVLCLQDDSTGDQISFSSSSPRGVYLFRSCQFQFFTLTGTGSVFKRGSIVTLTDPGNSGPRVLARFDESTKKGTASVIFPIINFRSTITDRNIADNSCTCSGSQP